MISPNKIHPEYLSRLQHPSCTYGPQLRDALDQLVLLIVEDLRHGFFELSVSCKIVSGSKRELIIQAGKSHKFTIQEDELSR